MSCWMGTSFQSCSPSLPSEACCPAPYLHLEVLLMSPSCSSGSCPPMTLWAVTGQAWTTSCVRSHSRPSTGSSHVPTVRDPLLSHSFCLSHSFPFLSPKLTCALDSCSWGPLNPKFPVPPLVLQLPDLQSPFLLFQGGNAPTGSSAGSSIQSGQAAPSARWPTSCVPMPFSRRRGPRARTEVAGSLHLHLSLALSLQSVSSAA